MQTKRQIQELLTTAGVSPNRRLGQHFLVDLNLLRLLVEAAQITRRDVVLEIGAGTGSLTETLAERAGQVITVELDPTLAGIAGAQLAGADNIKILNADVLSGKGTLNPAVTEAVTQARTRLAENGPQEPQGPAGEGAGDGRLLLVSNLPYDVASAVMIHLAKGPVRADAMFVTIQKEVAERMTAGPGSRDYGTLSIFLQATGTVELLRRLKPSVFWPPPGVDSAMARHVRDPARSGRILDTDLFGRVVALFLGHRRKMLRACVKEMPPVLGGRDLWLTLFEQHAIDPTRRPEELSPNQYVDLANSCHRLLRAP
ncbi:MAG: 16S rRNA (adenine(1518)-N(6)/adenine(1519)-N(6))-dimethyltransferase RsmA [Planctomycetes bacterium]|jgi:16S rRNA (adenine1518-N6/adenine1519-N6)-dimethyltransferase|nr:16S rRNA (adenine(1518)-N(6)/adenine(1519)-N(6))-dimethyltransferase RsmA [Planctomycetota bacterium]